MPLLIYVRKQGSGSLVTQHATLTQRTDGAGKPHCQKVGKYSVLWSSLEWDEGAGASASMPPHPWFLASAWDLSFLWQPPKTTAKSNALVHTKQSLLYL